MKKLVGFIFLLVGIPLFLYGVSGGRINAFSDHQVTCETEDCHKPPFVHFSCRENACVKVLGYGENTCKVNKDCKIIITPSPTLTPTATPTASPTSTPVPCTGKCGDPATFAGSTTEAPKCGNGDTVQLPANPFVIRKGSEATVNFFITQGDSANVYWSVLGQPHWGNSSASEYPNGIKPNSENFVSYTVKNLDPNQGYEFGIQQKYGCGGGQLVTAVIIDSPQSKVFSFSYWEWAK